MKNTVAILFLLFASILAKGQYSASGVNSDAFETFKGSKNITVVLTGDEATDNAMRDAIAKNWTLSPAVYISSSEFDAKISDKTTCFLLFCEIQGKEYQAYNFVAIIPGGKKSIKKYSYDDILAYCPYDRLLTEATPSAVKFRLPIVVNNLQSVLQKVEKSQLKGNSFSLGKAFNEINCKNLKKIKTKTLLINAELGLTEADIKEVYKYKFEICDKGKIEKAISSKDPNYLVFQSAISLNKFIFIFDCENYNCVYSNINISGMKVKQKDFSEIIKYLSN